MALKQVGDISPHQCRVRAMGHVSSGVCMDKDIGYYEEHIHGEPLQP